MRLFAASRRHLGFALQCAWIIILIDENKERESKWKRSWKPERDGDKYKTTISSNTFDTNWWIEICRGSKTIRRSLSASLYVSYDLLFPSRLRPGFLNGQNKLKGERKCVMDQCSGDRFLNKNPFAGTLCHILLSKSIEWTFISKSETNATQRCRVEIVSSIEIISKRV